ncbi:MAG: hypothetical protein HQK76_20725 [Desulfobacterales bacterium]|nr:hypothetical protein [Desulfobacterales bacterium]
MWKLIGLIGRDAFLAKDILKKVKSKNTFILVGAQGVGKTAVLEWAYEQAAHPKSYISADWTISKIIKKVAIDLKIQIIENGKVIAIDKAKRENIEKEINKQTNAIIFIDDFHKATPSKLQIFKLWNDIFKIYYAGTQPFRNEIMKLCLLGHSYIKVRELDNDSRLKLSKAVCSKLGSKNSPSEIAVNSSGNPSKIIAMAKGIIESATPRFSGEEIDTSFVYLFGLVFIIAMRVIGRQINDTGLYILGAIAMIVGIIARMYLSKGMQKK